MKSGLKRVACATVALLILAVSFLNSALAKSGRQDTLTGQALELHYAVSASMGQNLPRYHPIRDKNGWVAKTETQKYSTSFNSNGFELVAGQHTFGSSFAGVGYGNELTHPPVTNIRQSDNRIEYQRGNLTEWYVNGPLGLQQGFTLQQRPVLHAETGLITITLQVRGNLHPMAHSNQRGVSLNTKSGDTVLTYSGLLAFDANGTDLPARMLWDGAQLTLVADDSNAVYPITIDPVVQSAYLKSSDADAHDWFGFSVAVDGDTALVGALGDDSGGLSGEDNSVSNSGAVYVFTHSDGVWSQQALLKADNAETNDNFGRSVALDGDTAVIGALGEDGNGVSGEDNSVPNSGAVYVFTRSDGAWSQQAYLKADNADSDDHFGSSVAIDGDTVAVGAVFESGNGSGEADNSAPRAGAAYIFTRTDGTWSQQAYLKADNPDSSDFFGLSVALDGDSALIGALLEDSDGSDGADNSAPNAGAAYVFTRSSGVWSQQAYLKADNTDSDDHFGSSVAIEGDTAVIGAAGEAGNGSSATDNSAAGAGAAYVFTRSEGVWSQQAYLKADNADASDFFGISVALDGDTTVIGAAGEASDGSDGSGATDNSVPDTGAAYVFTRSDGAWHQLGYLKSNTADAADALGASVALDDQTVLLGAYQEDGNGGSATDNSTIDAGAAYMFDLSQATETSCVAADDFASATDSTCAEADPADLLTAVPESSTNIPNNTETDGESNACSGSPNSSLGTHVVGDCVSTSGAITLIKNVINDDGGTAGVVEFGLSIGGDLVNSGGSLSFADGTSVSINEIGTEGYNFVSITGDAKCPEALGGLIVVQSGDDIVCTITSDDDPTWQQGRSPSVATGYTEILQIQSSPDDAEQPPNKKGVLMGFDLGLIPEQLVGLRFENVQIPAGQVISEAYIQFTAEESGHDTSTATIWGEDADDAPVYARILNNISDRPITSADVDWTIAPWMLGDAGADQRTPNLAEIIQEIVNRPDWQRGNAIGLMIQAFQGRRTAWSSDSDPTSAPKLVVHVTSGVPTVEAPRITPGSGNYSGSIEVDIATSTPGATIYYTQDGIEPTMGDIACGCPISVSKDVTIKAKAFLDGYAESDTVRADFEFGLPTPGTLTLQILQDRDDAEERQNGRVTLFSNDLEMTTLKGIQSIGLRYQNVAIPDDAMVTYAYLIFTAKDGHSDTTTLIIDAEASANTTVFLRGDNNLFNITDRPITGASVEWEVPTWHAEDGSFAQISPDLTSVIQSVIDQPGWASGNALALIISGSGLRSAYTYDGDPAKAPTLHIEFDTP
ncbi:MAG: chitobiase/beta-hexosaminidase C-terminal domain-containing protein [Pseudomonadota bacterium]